MKKGLILLMVVMIGISASAQYKAPKIIAHRGFHASEGAAKNSLNALKAAQEAGFWGSECDLQLTKDGEVLVVHGPWHPGTKGARPVVHIHRSTKEKVQAIPLASGEKVSTLDEYLQQVASAKGTKLIIEIKDQPTPQLETEIVEKTIKAVAKYGLENEVEYIAFRPFVCWELARLAPKGTNIAYLNGDYSPHYCRSMGCKGIDYKYTVLKRKKWMIENAHKLGMYVNTWTVNKEDDIRWCIENGVDYITTDNPMLVRQIIAEMCK
ncbi:MAG: glycerophosphodiester phosphodiesterase [Alistipes sp.]|nr:glycerophosphodiester phosphodiesterase [Alistipes sp.]